MGGLVADHASIAAIAIRKPTDGTSALLFSYAINGNSMGDAELYVLEQRDGWSKPLATMEVQLGRAFVQSLQLLVGGVLGRGLEYEL